MAGKEKSITTPRGALKGFLTEKCFDFHVDPRPVATVTRGGTMNDSHVGFSQVFSALRLGGTVPVERVSLSLFLFFPLFFLLFPNDSLSVERWAEEVGFECQVSCV